MRTNFFGETVLHPGDDLWAEFQVVHDVEISEGDLWVWSNEIEHDEELGWCCTIQDGADNEVQVEKFESEEDLRDWLERLGVTFV